MKNFVTHMAALGASEEVRKYHPGIHGEMMLAFIGGILLTLFTASFFDDAPRIAFALLPFAFGSILAAYGVTRSYPHDDLGFCNLITLGRLALLSGLTPLIWASPQDASFWLAFGVAVVCLLLDGVDGWFARRTGRASQFGAIFDMEVDAGFALLLSIIVYSLDQAGIWVLALGLPHYAFVVAGLLWPWLTDDLPELTSRKAVCVLQITVLIAFLIPIIPEPLLLVAGVTAAFALVASFVRDVVYLYSCRKS